MRIEAIAQAALAGEALTARSLTQEFLRANPTLAEIATPAVNDPEVLAMTAALLELFAERTHQPPPAWTQVVGALPSPVYLLRAAKTMRRLRELCRDFAPEPLRRRNLFAPPNYLEMA